MAGDICAGPKPESPKDCAGMAFYKSTETHPNMTLKLKSNAITDTDSSSFYHIATAGLKSSCSG